LDLPEKQFSSERAGLPGTGSSRSSRSRPLHCRAMNTASFIAKNALRNKRRAALTILSVAVSLFLFVTLLVALRELTMPPEDVGASLRIAVRNKVSIANPLPSRQLGVIEHIPGIAAVTPCTFFGGKFKDDKSVG